MFEKCKSQSSLDQAYKDAIADLEFDFKTKKNKIIDAYNKQKELLRKPAEDYRHIPVEYISSSDEKPIINSSYRLIRGKVKSNQIVINPDGTIFI